MCVFLLLKVLGHGEVLEFDTPTALLSNRNSYFVSLVEQTGSGEAEYLRTLAKLMNAKIKDKKEEKIANEELISSENENDPPRADQSPDNTAQYSPH